MCFTLHICKVVWGLFIDYNRIAVKYVYNVAGIFVQGHMPII